MVHLGLRRCSHGGAITDCSATRLPLARMRHMPTKWVNVESIGSYFESLSDPRHTRNRKHLLVDIVVIAVCGMVCGCDGPTAIHRWAENRRDWLAPVPVAPQRDPLARLHPPTADRAQARGVSEVLPGLDHRRDPDRRLRSGPADRHRRQDLSRVPRRVARTRSAAHRQRLGQRGRDRPGPGRDRGEIQRNHGDPRAPEADRPDRTP